MALLYLARAEGVRLRLKEEMITEQVDKHSPLWADVFRVLILRSVLCDDED